MVLAGYCGPDLLRRGGTAVLEPDFSSQVEPNVEQTSAAQGIDRPSLQQGKAVLHMQTPPIARLARLLKVSYLR